MIYFGFVRIQKVNIQCLFCLVGGFCWSRLREVARKFEVDGVLRKVRTGGLQKYSTEYKVPSSCSSVYPLAISRLWISTELNSNLHEKSHVLL